MLKMEGFMEIWDLYTDERMRTDKTMMRGDRVPEGYYRIVVHICIFNSEGKMLIQQRQPFKKGWPDKWDITVGGSAVSGDDSRSAAHRELLEELGLSLPFDSLRPMLTVNFDGGFDDVYLIRRDVDVDTLVLQPEEVKTVRWASLAEILEMIDSGEFIPYDKNIISAFFSMCGAHGMIND